MNTPLTYQNVNFLLHKPGWGGRQPLIIFLHGIGEKGDTLSAITAIEKAGGPIRTTVTEDICERKGNNSYNFFVIAPQLGTNYGAWTAEHVIKMIDYAKANLDIDTNRIYLMGLSLGGGGVWTALQNETVASQVSAATVCCGTNMLRSAEMIVKHRVFVQIFHAVNDPTVPISVSEKAYAMLRAAGANVRYYRMADLGHNVWSTVFSPTKKSYKLSTGVWTVNSPGPYDVSLNYAKNLILT